MFELPMIAAVSLFAAGGISGTICAYKQIKKNYLAIPKNRHQL